MWPFRKKKLSMQIERRLAVPSVLEELSWQRRYTPDMARLEMLEFHYVFVCGEMQEGHHQHEMIADEERTGFEAFTQNPYHFLMNDLGRMSHPLLFHENIPDSMWKLPKLPVKGEIIKVKPRRFLELDNYYHNTVRFIRLPVLLVVPLSTITFKDRNIAENAFGKWMKDKVNVGKKFIRPEGSFPLQSATLTKKVFRLWTQTYFAPSNYWYELLTDYKNPPIKTFTNPKGIVKQYSRFIVDDYDPPF